MLAGIFAPDLQTYVSGGARYLDEPATSAAAEVSGPKRIETSSGGKTGWRLGLLCQEETSLRTCAKATVNYADVKARKEGALRIALM